MVVWQLVDFLVKWKPFFLLWSHDRKAPYANDVGQKRFCSKKWCIHLEKLRICPNMTPFLTVLIDNYDRNRTRTLTQTRWLNHLIYSWWLKYAITSYLSIVMIKFTLITTTFLYAITIHPENKYFEEIFSGRECKKICYQTAALYYNHQHPVQ